MDRTTRSVVIKFRATPEERDSLDAKASALGQTRTDYIRQRTLDYRLRISPLEKERQLLLARIGSNLNQLARVANTYKAGMDAVRIIAALAAIEEALKADTPPAAQAGEAL